MSIRDIPRDAPTTQIRTDDWHMSEFYELIKEGKLRKPRIQRKKAWDQKGAPEMTREYIVYIIKHRHTCQPIYLSDESTHFMLFDGNNRVNAIVQFLEAPIALFPELVPEELTHHKDLVEKLSDMSLADLTDGITIDQYFFKEKGIPPPHEDSMSVIQKLGRSLTDQLKSFRFGTIRVQYTLFKGLTFDSMCHIYESINKNGCPLTEQDLLASSLAAFTYTDLADQSYLVEKIEQIYDERNEVERLKMTDKVFEVNLFEVILALQMELESQEIPKTDKTNSLIFEMGGGNLDAVFIVYRNVHGDGQTFPARSLPVDKLNTFVRKVREAIQLLVQILSELYFMFPKYMKMKKYHTILFMTYIISSSKPADVIKSTIKRGIVFHELVKCSKATPEITEKDLLDVERIKRARRRFMTLLSNGELNAPTNDEITGMMLYTFENTSRHPKRRSICTVKAIALSSFYYHAVPPAKNDTFETDHIIPFSSIFATDCDVDICRLGNLQLIPSTINKSRGAKPITDAWIVKHMLMYQHYPSEAEYDKVWDGKQFNVSAFESMCVRREKYYLDCILKNISI